MSTNISFTLPRDKKQLSLPRNVLIWKDNNPHVLKEDNSLQAVEGHAIDSMNFAITKGLSATEKVWSNLEISQ